MADAVVRIKRQITLKLTEDEAFVVHALASRGEELDSDHPIFAGSRSVYVALSGVLNGGIETDYLRKQKLYDSIEIHEKGEW